MVPLALLGLAVLFGACPASTPPRAGQGDGARAARAEPNGLAGQARQAFEDGRFADALAFANEALRRDDADLAAGLVKAESHLALGERALALRAAERLMERFPRVPEALYAHGKALMAVGRALAAVNAFEGALRQDEADPLARLGLVAAMALVTRYDLANVDGLAQELARDRPELLADTLHHRAIAREQRGDKDGAIALYRESLRVTEAPLVHYNLGRLLHETAGLEAARPHYERFVALAGPAWRHEREHVLALLTGRETIE